MSSRFVKAFFFANRYREVWAAIHLFENSPEVICRFVLRYPDKYPFSAKLRSGYEIVCVDWDDLTTVWAVFCADEYSIPQDAEQIIDVGANTGCFSLLATIQAPGCRVIAVEAFPATAERLKANLTRWELADRVSVVVAAAGATDEDVYFPTEVSIPSHSRYVVQAKGENNNMLTVPGMSLETLLAQSLKRIDLLKIDIEGSEVEFLLGNHRWERIVQVQVEWHGRERREKVRQHLEDAGFRLVSEKARKNVGTAHFMGTP